MKKKKKKKTEQFDNPHLGFWTGSYVIACCAVFFDSLKLSFFWCSKMETSRLELDSNTLFTLISRGPAALWSRSFHSWKISAVISSDTSISSHIWSMEQLQVSLSWPSSVNSGGGGGGGGWLGEADVGKEAEGVKAERLFLCSCAFFLVWVLQ